MKYLENPDFEKLAQALSVETAECRLDVRLEAYSVKMVANDKRAWRDFLEQQGGSPHDRQPLSPPVNDTPWTFTSLSPNTLSARHRHRSRCSSGGSDFETDNGVVLCDTISQKTLFHLISLLNASYTDYDFTDAKGEDFQRVHEYETVKTCVRSKLAALVRDKRLQQLWSTIEGEITPKECMIYSYKSDAHMDAFNEDGILWSFNYFFANRRLKRILFLSCQAYSSQSNDSAYSSDALWSVD